MATIKIGNESKLKYHKRDELLKEIDKYKKDNEELIEFVESLEARLAHLLSSKTICEYDNVHPFTKKYIKDINELDERIEKLEEENKELKEELKIANDNLKTKQWFNDNQFKLLMKYDRAFEILNDKLWIKVQELREWEKKEYKKEYELITHSTQRFITKKEYQLLEELLKS